MRFTNLPNELLDKAAENLDLGDFQSMRRAVAKVYRDLDTGSRVVKVGRLLFPFCEY